MISVIIPCYNTEKNEIDRCIQSILAQSMQDFEIIVIDDGSLDQYKEYLSCLPALDPRINVYRQENGGVSSARNNGLKKAKGEYIVFADSDDMLMPYFFEEALKIAQEQNADFVIGGNAALHNCNGKDVESAPEHIKVQAYKGNDKQKIKQYFVGSLLHFGEHGYFGRGPWTRLVKKELAESVPFDCGMKIGEDIIWNLQLLKKCQKACLVHRVWYGYYTGGISATRGYNKDTLVNAEAEIRAIRKQLDLSKNNEYIAYCDRLLEDLKRIYKCYLSKAECPMSKQEKRTLIHKFYTQEPWKLIGEIRYFKLASPKQKFKAVVYRTKIIFKLWAIMDR